MANKITAHNAGWRTQFRFADGVRHPAWLHVMQRLRLALLALFLAGCQTGWVVSPADGRVIDARSHLPIERAEVTRTYSHARPTTTLTDSAGYFIFQGVRELQSAVGVRNPRSATYHITAPGYQSMETNAFAIGGSNDRDLRLRLGEIQLQPK